LKRSKKNKANRRLVIGRRWNITFFLLVYLNFIPVRPKLLAQTQTQPKLT
jgi:hypothetical protein